MANSRVPAGLRNSLLALAAAMGAGAAGINAYRSAQDAPSPAVQIAMQIGSHYESGGRHIGKPYIDRIGKGQPLTVCAGITGPDVDPDKFYTPDDCTRLELPHYLQAEREAKGAMRYWSTYNPWVQASFIDMYFNIGARSLAGSTALRLANAGNLPGACAQMSRWVYGTVRGVSTRLNGLVDRRGTTEELCTSWGRDGQLGASLLADNIP